MDLSASSTAVAPVINISRAQEWCRRAFRPPAAQEHMIWSRAHRKSAKTDEYWMKRLKTVFGRKTLAEISPEVVEGFKLKLAENRSKATVSRHLAL